MSTPSSIMLDAKQASKADVFAEVEYGSDRLFIIATISACESRLVSSSTIRGAKQWVTAAGSLAFPVGPFL